MGELCTSRKKRAAGSDVHWSHHPLLQQRKIGEKKTLKICLVSRAVSFNALCVLLSCPHPGGSTKRSCPAGLWGGGSATVPEHSAPQGHCPAGSQAASAYKKPKSNSQREKQTGLCNTKNNNQAAKSTFLKSSCSRRPGKARPPQVCTAYTTVAALG